MSLGTKDNAGKLSYTELGSFFENMAMMVKSGISVPEAASLLMEVIYKSFGFFFKDFSRVLSLEDCLNFFY